LWLKADQKETVAEKVREQTVDVVGARPQESQDEGNESKTHTHIPRNNDNTADSSVLLGMRVCG
jgi:hypothetical protein